MLTPSQEAEIREFIIRNRQAMHPYVKTDMMADMMETIDELRGPGSLYARFYNLLDELVKRFPNAAPPFSSRPPELQLLAAIDELRDDVERHRSNIHILAPDARRWQAVREDLQNWKWSDISFLDRPDPEAKYASRESLNEAADRKAANREDAP